MPSFLVLKEIYISKKKRRRDSKNPCDHRMTPSFAFSGFHLFKSTKSTDPLQGDARDVCQEEADPLGKAPKRVSDESAIVATSGASKRPRKEDRLASNRSKSKELNLSMAASAYAEEGEMEVE